MHIVPGSITHRLVGLFMAVLMPLCCCSTQVLGEVMLDDTSPMTRIGSCCSGFADADTSDCDEPSGTHDRCDCVRGHLDGGIAVYLDDRASRAPGSLWLREEH